jgi:hypothetical protein
MTSTGRRFRNTGLIGLLLVATVFTASGCAGNDKPERTVATIDAAGASDAPKAPGGGPGGAPGGEPGGSSGGDPVAYSKCMREKGVVNFPDPDQNGRIHLDPNTVDQESSEFRAAQEACRQYAGTAAKVKPDAQTQWSTEDKLKYADCMRKNGLPNFPDPDKNGQLVLPRSIDNESEQFKGAEAACAQFKPGGMPQGGGGAPGGPAPGGAR